MNNQNLIPFNKRTKEELEAISRAGGIASGAERKRRAERKKALLQTFHDRMREEALVDDLMAEYDSWQRHKRYLNDKKRRAASKVTQHTQLV